MNMQAAQQPFHGHAMDLTCGYQYSPRAVMDYFHSCKSKSISSSSSFPKQQLNKRASERGAN
jgi:hypothetical protein